MPPKSYRRPTTHRAGAPSFLACLLTVTRVLVTAAPPLLRLQTAMDPRINDSSSVLENASFTHSPTAPNASDTPVTANDFLLGAFDPAKLHPMAGLEDKLDYLLLDDDKTSDLPGSGTAIPSRGWSDDLCYGTGTMYLSGSYLCSSPFHHLILWSYIIGIDASCVIYPLSALTRYL